MKKLTILTLLTLFGINILASGVNIVSNDLNSKNKQDENLDFVPFKKEIIENNFKFDIIHMFCYEIGSTKFPRLPAIVRNDIWTFYDGWLGKTDLQKDYFKKSNEFKTNDSAFQKIRKDFQNSISYFRWDDYRLKNYNLNTGKFTFVFSETADQKVIGLDQMARPVLCLKSTQNDFYYMPSLPIKIVGYKMDPVYNRAHYDAHLELSISVDKETALRIEESSVSVYFIILDNLSWGTKHNNYLYWFNRKKKGMDNECIDQFFNNQFDYNYNWHLYLYPIDFYITKAVRMIIVDNNNSREIYYSKLYKPAPPVAKKKK